MIPRAVAAPHTAAAESSRPPRRSLAGRALGAAVRALDRLSPKWVDRVVRAAAGIAWLLLPTARRDAARLGRALGQPPLGFSLRCFLASGRNVAHMLLLRRSAFRVLDHVHVSSGDLARLQGWTSTGRGIVFASLHLGPFEWTAALVQELGLRPVAVARRARDATVDAVLNQHRHARRVEMIYRGTAERARAIVRALREGRPVGMMLDLARSVRRTPVPFHGRILSIATGPATLAMRLGCPLVVGVVVPQSAGHLADHRLRLFEVPTPHDVWETSRALGEIVERLVGEHPDQWLPWGQPVH